MGKKGMVLGERRGGVLVVFIVAGLYGGRSLWLPDWWFIAGELEEA
jgi:hypothetical protein